MRPPWGPGGPRGGVTACFKTWSGRVWSCRVRPGGLLHLSSPAASLSSFDPTEARAAPGGSFPHLPASALTLPHFPVEWGRVPTPRSALLFSPPAFTEASATSPKHHRLTRVLPQPPLSLPAALFGRAWSSVHERVACTETRPHFPLLLPALSGLRPHLSIEGTLIQLPAPPGHLWATYFSIEAFVSRPALALDWAEKTQVRVF